MIDPHGYHQGSTDRLAGPRLNSARCRQTAVVEIGDRLYH
jgi:hypothetical protein